MPAYNVLLVTSVFKSASTLLRITNEGKHPIYRLNAALRLNGTVETTDYQPVGSEEAAILQWNGTCCCREFFAG